MESVINFRNIVAGIGLLSLSCAVYASDVSLPTISSSYTDNTKSYLLALNDADTATPQAVAVPLLKPAEFKPPFFTSSNAHQYLGLGTIVMVGLAAVTNPGEGCEHNCVSPQPPRQTSGTAHTRFARAAATMAAATVASGLIAHWDDFHLEDGFTDPDNMHAMLGAAGAALMMYAVRKSANSSTETSHAGMAELGGLAMAVAIKLTW
ncbi:MAG: hypothetical protein ABL902_10105 [Gallionella sp.]